MAPEPWICGIGVYAAPQSMSSFWIVPSPWPSATVTPVPATVVTFTKNDSVGSNEVSPLTSTSNV